MGAASFAIGCSGGGGASPAQAAAAWIKAHPKGWSLAIDDRESGHALQRASWSGGCTRGPAPVGTWHTEQPSSAPPGSVTVRYATSDTSIDISFRCPIRAPVTPEVLDAALSYVALEKLPHGITVPHWQFQVATPVSSFSEGVKVTAVANGRLALRIETRLYAVRGHDTRPECEAPMDSGMRPECFVHREHPIPLSLTMDVPFDPEILR